MAIIREAIPKDWAKLDLRMHWELQKSEELIKKLEAYSLKLVNKHGEII